MAQQAKVVKVGPGGRNHGPRPKVENPGKVLKRILAYVMQQYKVQVILVLCCILLAVFAQVQGTLFMQTLIDSYILPLLAEKSNDFSGLAHAILRVACFYGVGILAVFIVAQRISSVENADKVLVLDNGRVSGFDTPANLLQTNAIYQDVYNSQTKGSGDFDEKGGEA